MKNLKTPRSQRAAAVVLMMSGTLHLLLGLLLINLAGCSTLVPWTQLKGALYTDSNRKFKATVPAGWMRFNADKNFVITRDGVKLNQITVIRGAPDVELENTKKRFSAEMTPQELGETQTALLKSTPDITDVVIVENRPITIGQSGGFLLKYTFRNNDGLRYEGRAAGFLHGRWIYRLFYEAPTQHYFPLYEPHWETFLESFQIVPPE
jgi:hypothetical protein